MNTVKLKSLLGGLLAKRIDIWFFYGFLITFPFTIRKVITFYPVHGVFNEYTGIYLYLSDLFLLVTLLFWGIIILCNKWHYLSTISFSWLKEGLLTKKWVKIEISPIILLPLLLVIWEFISILWSANQPIALFRSTKLLEFFLLFLYIRQNFNTIFKSTLFHGEQKLKNIKNENCSTWNNENRECSMWNIDPIRRQRIILNIIHIFIYIGLFNAFLAFLQIANNGSIGLQFIKESIFNLNMSEVAKVTLGNKPFIRPYGIFPHPNILGAYLIASLVMTIWYFKFKIDFSGENTSLDVPRGTLLLKFTKIFLLIKKGFGAIFCSTWNKIILKLEKSEIHFSKLFHKEKAKKLKFYESIQLKGAEKKCFTWNNSNTIKHCKRFCLLALIAIILTIIVIFGLNREILAFSQIVNKGLNIAFSHIAAVYSKASIIFSTNTAYHIQIIVLGILIIFLVVFIILSKKRHFSKVNSPVKQFILKNSIFRSYSIKSRNVIHGSIFSMRNIICSTWNKIVNIKLFQEIRKIFQNLYNYNCSTWNKSLKNEFFKKFLFHVEQFSESIFHVKISALMLLLYIIILLFPLLALLLTFSKNAIIGLFIAILSISFQFYIAKKGQHSRVIPFIKPFISDKLLTKRNLILLAIFIMILVNLRPSFESFFSKSLDDRIIFQNVSRETISKNLFLGVGSGQFVPSMEQYSKMPLLIWQHQPVHNVFSLIWSEIGIVGLLLFAGFVFTIFRSFGNSLDSNSQTIHTKAVFRGLFIAFLFMMLFDHYLWDIQQGMALWWIVLALI